MEGGSYKSTGDPMYPIKFENIKKEVEEFGCEEVTSKEIISLRKKIIYEEEVHVGTSNQSSGPVHSKGRKSVTVKQCRKGKQKGTPRAVCELLEERGGKPGLFLKYSTSMEFHSRNLWETNFPEVPLTELVEKSSSVTELMRTNAYFDIFDTRENTDSRNTESSQEDTDDEQQYLQYTSALESAAVQSDEDAEDVKRTAHSPKNVKREGAARRGRGRGRGRARGKVAGGRGRGRARGKVAEGSPRDTTSLQSNLPPLRREALDTKRALSKLPVNVRAERAERMRAERTRAEQAQRFLLPDAPSRKRTRTDSPERAPCRLVAGTPAVPPPPVPQPWQLRLNTTLESVRDATGYNNDEDLLRCQCPDPEASSQQHPPQSPASSAVVSRQSLKEPTGSTSHGTESRSDQQVLAWLDELDNIAVETEITMQEMEQMEVIEDEELDREDSQYNDYVAAVALDPTNDMPANLPEHFDTNLGNYLSEQDREADQLVRELLTTDTDNMTFDWSCEPDTFRGQREKFVGPSGPTFSLRDCDRPMDIFFKFFDDEIVDVIVTETNRNCDRLQRLQTERQRISRQVNRQSTILRKTDRPEILIFLGMLILQGVLPLPVERDYFRESNGYLTLQYFRKIMSYSRFVILKKLLHFADNDSTDPRVTNQKLRKLGPLLNLLNRKFKSLYLPSRDIAIDESLLKWQGRLSFAQRIATKAAKFGVKSYELCESSTGYCWNFFFYTGKGTHVQTDGQTNIQTDEDTNLLKDAQQTDTLTDRQRDGVVVSTSATAQIVLDLVRPLLNRGHTLIMDNFYNSPLLARYLKLNGTDCFGTLRVNRQFVPEAVKSTSKSMLRRGEVVVSYCRDMTVTLWFDANVVAMISTVHGGEVGGKEKYGHYKYKPQVVLDYNLSMGGVDKKDQLLASHPIERIRNQSWYKKVFRRLLNVTVLNAFIIYRTKYPKITQRDFRTTLADEMIAQFKGLQVELPCNPVVRTTMVIRKGKNTRPILQNNHFIATGAKKHLTCKWCKKSRTKYICKQCNVSLCLEDCFEKFHTSV